MPEKNDPTTHTAPSRRYSNYVLFVLVLVYVFNFIDRQILSILAEDIKRDLGLSDAGLGFLYGTAFAVFYAIFGIPLSRLADVWTRKSLISVGLFFWSGMTALSGTARSFASLATFRIGVGVGESSASPAAFSMLGDYFPPRLRATAVAIYSSGVYIGSGIGLIIGGLVVDNWNKAFEGGGAPFGLVGWQAAFFAVGLPGLLMSIWVWTLREPIRGSSEGITTAPPTKDHPIGIFLRETAAVLPPFTLISLTLAAAKARKPAPMILAKNLIGAALCTVVAYLLTQWLGSGVQWIALFIGVYAFISWLQGLALRDPATHAMIFGSKAVVYGMIGFAWLAFVGYANGFWAAPFLQRFYDLPASKVGPTLGVIAAVAGWIGVSGGGFFSDWLRRRNPKARLHAGMFCALLAAPIGAMFVTAKDVNVAYFWSFLFNLFSSFWIGSAVALANEMVLPRMRATASAYYILAVTFIGLALGPFTVGQISTRIAATGVDGAEALKTAMLWGLIAYGLAAFFLWLSSRHVTAEESSRLERARQLGEPI